jgi:hypothetical protein
MWGGQSWLPPADGRRAASEYESASRAAAGRNARPARTPRAFLFVAMGLLSAGALTAQDFPLPNGAIAIRFPDDSPVLFSGSMADQSRARARGGAMEIDLHLQMTLRNVGDRGEIRGITLRVVSQEVAVGGKGSVAYPSLHVARGESFPVKIDMQLMRPSQAINGPVVEVSLDGVLFQDLSFYGDNRLNSRRTMRAWELEARRDRDYFKRVLAQQGVDGLKNAALASLGRQAERPRLDVRVLSGGPAVAAAALASQERAQQFAFLELPDSPVSPKDGWARISGNEARAPRVEIQNNSNRVVKYVELGWLVSDASGKRFMAASLPASGPDLILRPGQTARVLQETALRFSRQGQPVNVQAMAGFVSQVEFADGEMWVPNRQSLERADLLDLVAPSAEEQRLTDLYRKRGINALVEELKKY